MQASSLDSLAEMDLSQSGNSHRYTKILVAPLEPCDPDFFARTFTRMKKCYERIPKSTPSVIIELVDKVPDPSWDDFQFHKRIVGVIGIMNCMSLEKIPPTKEWLDMWRSSLPSSMHTACFGFNASPGLEDSTVSLFPEDSVATPSDSVNTQIFEQLQNLELLFTDLLGGLVSKMSNEKADLVKLLRAPTEMDPRKQANAGIGSTGALHNESKLLGPHRKKCIGRHQKQLGDILVMQGDLAYAVIAYQNAQKILKDINDFLWLGSVMESYAICLQLKTNEDNNPSPDESIAMRYREASQLYCKSIEAYIPRIECHFKLARYHQQQGEKLYAMNAISSIFDVKLAVDEREKVYLFMSVGIFLKSLGMERKSSFFLRRAALTQLQFKRYEYAKTLLLKISPVYKMGLLPNFLEGSPIDQKELQQQGGWPICQAMLLRDIMFTTMKLSATERTARMVAYFCNHIQNENARLEVLPGLLQELSTAVKITICPHGLLGVPEIHSLHVGKIQDHLSPIPVIREKGLLSGPFIYTPIASLNISFEKDCLWIAEEVVELSIKIRNSLAEDITIERLSLYTEGVAFESYPVKKFRLLARQTDMVILLRGKALKPGQLRIRGFLTTAFNVDSIHWLPSSVAITVIKPLPRLLMYSGDGCYAKNSAINLLCGQHAELNLRFENIGQISIHRLCIKICWGEKNFNSSTETARIDILSEELQRTIGSTGIRSVEAKIKGCIIDCDLIQNQWPLLPGHTSMGTLHVIPFHTGLSPLQIHVEYFGLDAAIQFYRHKAEDTRALALHSDPSTTMEEDTFMNSEFYRSLMHTIDLQSGASVVVSHLEINRCPRPGVHAAQEECKITQEDLPTLPDPESDMILSFHIENQSTSDANVKILLRGDHLQTIPLQGRCKSKVNLLVPKSELRVAEIDFSCMIHDMGIITTAIMTRLQQIIVIEWEYCKVLGHAHLNRPAKDFQSRLISLLRPATLALECKPECPKVNELNIYSCRLYDVVNITFTVKNISKTTNPKTQLSILSYQTMENGTILFNSSESLQSIGTLEAWVPDLAPEEEFSHKVSFLCLQAGHFHLSYHCRPADISSVMDCEDSFIEESNPSTSFLLTLSEMDEINWCQQPISFQIK